jgi:hypothetical protein
MGDAVGSPNGHEEGPGSAAELARTVALLKELAQPPPQLGGGDADTATTGGSSASRGREPSELFVCSERYRSLRAAVVALHRLLPPPRWQQAVDGDGNDSRQRAAAVIQAVQRGNLARRQLHTQLQELVRLHTQTGESSGFAYPHLLANRGARQFWAQRVHDASAALADVVAATGAWLEAGGIDAHVSAPGVFGWRLPL